MTSTETAAGTAPAWASIWTARALDELPADLTAATPAQVDEVIRTVQLDAAAIDSRIERAVTAVRKAIGQHSTQTYEGTGRNRRTVTVWPGSARDAIDTARALPPYTPNADYYARENVATVGAALAALDTAVADSTTTTAILARLDGEFTRRGGWARYYRVDNSNGHVHVALDCRTTYPTTRWQWPTGLSGATHAEVVDAAGALTCLVCFPDVREDIIAGRPTDDRRFETREQTAAREAREDEAQAKRDAKIAKGVTADGSPLIVAEPRFRGETTSPRELKTARAAELAYVEFAAKARIARNADKAPVYTASAEIILAALAAKRGTDVETLRATFTKKVDKKFNTENW